ncbi:MAG: 50S ribosomal protein L11 methyltransferase [Chitinophagaceae bacterium]|nr:50S ribosomal protein L11 methyltransferase [Chitinophagaceae bacterium]
MSNYTEITFNNISSEQSSILVANLSEEGYEGFEESEDELKAYIPTKNFDVTIANRIATEVNSRFTTNQIGDVNWNELWESNFQPVVVDDFVGIRADFHYPNEKVEFEIVVTPKMSFGTGHHATTYMMVQQMREIAFEKKSVLDFGTGTGILAILAEKLGADQVVAIDHDEWSILNAKENIERNSCSKIELLKAESIDRLGKFDIILANINKNVIIDNSAALGRQLSPGGILLLSGLLPEDEYDVFHILDAYSLHLIQRVVRDNWLCLKLSY